MSDKPPPRPLRSPLVTAEAPAGSPRSATAVPPPMPSRFSPSSAPSSSTAVVTASRAPVGTGRAPVAKAVADDDIATKLFASATAEQAELTVIAGQYKGKTVALGAGTVVIGRSSDCELSLKGATGASRRHCKVQYLGNRFVVIDLESRNGTVVNGQSVERKVLEQGDKIEIGDEVIQFIIHRLADLGMIDDGLSPFEETASKTLKQQQQQPSLVDAVSRSIGELGNEIVTASPRTTFTSPVVVSPLAVMPPATLSTPAPPSSRLPYVFGALAILILGGGAALIYDLAASDPVVDEATVAALTSAKAEEEELREEKLREEKLREEKLREEKRSAAVVVDAGTVAVAAVAAVVVDAGTAAVAVGTAAVVDTGAAAAFVGAADASVIVRATSAGRASVVKVKVGDVVKVGDIVVVVGGDNGTMARKLQALQREEREFAEAARKDSSLSGDLESIRREMKKIAARLETKPQRSTAAGTVVEVLVKEGDVVRDGAPIVALTP